jgi:chemotaxis protein MotB
MLSPAFGGFAMRQIVGVTAVGAIAMLLTSGCITQSRFEEKESELAACVRDAKAAGEASRTEITDLRAQIARCEQGAEEMRRNTERFKTREADLRLRLGKELADRDVEIERLKDQLSVRVLDRILFRSGSADILPAGKQVLDKLANVLKETDDLIRVEGHTDNVPIGERLKDRYFSNWELSAARAATVVRYLPHGHSIDPVRLEAVGYAEYRPIAPNDSASNRQRNRRVSIELAAPRPVERTPVSH